MLEYLFGNKNTEKILFFILVNKQAHPRRLARIFGASISSIQNALERLEFGGIIASRMEGNTRLYQWNPRCYFLKEVQQLIQKAYHSLPDSTKKELYERPEERRRPRRSGKPL